VTLAVHRALHSAAILLLLLGVVVLLRPQWLPLG
jgi:hypothetical protein